MDTPFLGFLSPLLPQPQPQPQPTPNPNLPHRNRKTNTNTKAVLISPAIDSKYRNHKAHCTRCGDDRYTRFRYFNNKVAVLTRGAEPQPRYACHSPTCLANNPGKSEVEFTLDGKTRKPYLKKKRTAVHLDHVEEIDVDASSSSRRRSHKHPRHLSSSSSSFPTPNNCHASHSSFTNDDHGRNDSMPSMMPSAPPLQMVTMAAAFSSDSLPPLVDIDLHIDIDAFHEALSFLHWNNNNNNLQEASSRSCHKQTSDMHGHGHGMINYDGGDHDLFSFSELLKSTNAHDMLHQHHEKEDLLEPWIEEEDSLEGLNDIATLMAQDEAKAKELVLAFEDEKQVPQDEAKEFQDFSLALENELEEEEHVQEEDIDDDVGLYYDPQDDDLLRNLLRS